MSTLLRRIKKNSIFFILLWLAAWAMLVAAQPQHGAVVVVSVKDVITPATASFLKRTIETSQDGEASLIVIELDTPGGLDSSMRSIIQSILASRVPVVTYVHPEGARAASAGTFILYASHVAAMTPATNLGAATPVALTESSNQREKPVAPGSEKRAGSETASRDKAVNDAAAYIRSLAELRGRDTAFAEEAVRSAASLSATEALQRGVIDLIATDIPDLLMKLDGREVTLAAGKRVLTTKAVNVDYREPDFRDRFLMLIAHPQVALILMMLGVYGLFFEFTSPGFGVPGIAGIICLLVALYSLQMMPVNWVGVALVFLGLALMVTEALTPSFGVFGVGGVIAFIVGGIFLVDRGVPGYSVSPALIAGAGVFSAIFIFLIGTMAIRSQKRPIVSGSEEMIGQEAVITGIHQQGIYWVRINGENWRAQSDDNLMPGQAVRVVRMEGLTLFVAPLASKSKPTGENS